jgi:hypothetical protein
VPRKRAAVPPLLMPDDWHADATPRAFDEEPVVDIRREDEQVEAEHAHDSGADIWAVRAADG